jgi:arylsulfatase A-like enzyme
LKEIVPMSLFSMPRHGPLAAGRSPASVLTPPPAQIARSAAIATPPRRQRSALWLACWLAVWLVAAKAIHLGRPLNWTAEELTRYQRNLAIAVHQDLIFALALGGVAQLLLWLTARKPRLQTITWIALLAVAAFSAFYGIVNFVAFGFVGAPLTWALLSIAGGPRHIASSLAHFATPLNLALLLAAPLAFVALVIATPRLLRLKRDVRLGWKLRTVQSLVAILLAAYVLFARAAATGADWLDRPDRQISLNPHWVLMSSFFSDLASGNASRLDGPFAAEHLVDFQLVGERVGEDDADTRLASLLPPGMPRPRNVITLVIESCAIQHMSLYGSKYKTTPRLDAEAAAGNALVFDNFYCHQGLTANSLVSMSLSVYPPTVGWPVTANRPELPGKTLQQLLALRGYRSAFISSGDNDYLTQDKFLAGRGFDEVWDATALSKQFGYEKIFSWGVADHCMIDAMLYWLDRDPRHEKPFYLLGWTQQTHHPYELTPGQPVTDFIGSDKYLSPEDYNNYLNCLHTADAQVGRLLDELQRRGLADDTLVVITGDHGEAFGTPHDVWGHGTSVFEEGVHVPLVIWNPRLFKSLPTSARRLPQLGGHVDLNPTVADLLQLPADPSWQGRSLFDPDHPDRAYFFSCTGDCLLAVREDHFKYVYNATLARETLYDLAHDPTEQTDVAAAHPQLCDTFRQRITAWVRHENAHYANLLSEEK